MEGSERSHPPRCPCGFWGSNKTHGLCSKCYKDKEHKEKGLLKDKADLLMTKDLVRNSDIDNGKPSVLTPAPGPSDPANPNSSILSIMTHNSTSCDGASSSSKSLTGTSENKCISESDLQTVNESSPNKNSMSSDRCSPMQGSENKDSPEKGATSTKTEEEKRGVKRKLPVDGKTADVSSPESTPEKAGQKNKKRCYHCKCRLELAQRQIGKCRCDYVFCSLHRLPELHDCQFDHKEDGRKEALEKMVKPTRHLGTSFKRIDSDS